MGGEKAPKNWGSKYIFKENIKNKDFEIIFMVIKNLDKETKNFNFPDNSVKIVHVMSSFMKKPLTAIKIQKYKHGML